MIVDWSSDENLVLLNPRLPAEFSDPLQKILKEGLAATGLKSHVFLLTSGTTATSVTGFKWVALSKAAILAASFSANRHLESHAKDVWLYSLPEFHIGGLSIRARSFLSGARVVRSSCASQWNPARFVQEVTEAGATLCSLVPTQVHDLVRGRHPAPESLRAILLGGGATNPELLTRARELGWPLLPTYGMSEAASQVATASLKNADEKGPSQLEILPHLEASIGTDQRIRIRGESLLTGYIVSDTEDRAVFKDPKVDGWFVTEDFGQLEGRCLSLMGRVSDRIKIGGELVHLGRLEAILEEEASPHGLSNQITLVPVPDERLESVIHAVYETQANPMTIEKVVERFNGRVLPFERIRAMKAVPTIPRTDLGKIKRAELKSLLSIPSP